MGRARRYAARLPGATPRMVALAFGMVTYPRLLQSRRLASCNSPWLSLILLRSARDLHGGSPATLDLGLRRLACAFLRVNSRDVVSTASACEVVAIQMLNSPTSILTRSSRRLVNVDFTSSPST